MLKENGFFHDQVNEVAMGSPLAPVPANFFMSHYEELWLRNCIGPKALCYHKKYIIKQKCKLTKKELKRAEKETEKYSTTRKNKSMPTSMRTRSNLSKCIQRCRRWIVLKTN